MHVDETCYQSIFRTNNIIAKVEGNTPAKVIIIAEAKALRAYYYFELVTMFGDVPLVTIELSSNEYAKAADPASEVWTQIETDLTDAIAGLKVKSQGDAWRISKGTAQALLGKAYLYRKKYAQAVTQFNDVIASGEYKLVKDFSQILKKETEFGSELLFEISYETNQGNQWSNFQWGNGRRQ